MFKYLLRRIVLVGEDGFAIGIHNLGIADGFRIIAIVRQRSVCLCHFTNRCTFGQRTQRHRRIIHIIIGGQCGKAQLFRHEIISRLGGQHFEHLHGYRVGGIRNALHDGGLSVIPAVFIAGPCRTAQIEYRHIRNYGIGGNQLLVDCRGIYAQRLDRGARRPFGLGGTVEHKALGFLSASAHNAPDLSVGGIQHHHGGFRTYAVFRNAGEIAVVLINRFHGFLHIHIHGGIDGQAAAVDHSACIGFGITQLLLQILDHI